MMKASRNPVDVQKKIDGIKYPKIIGELFFKEKGVLFRLSNKYRLRVVINMDKSLMHNMSGTPKKLKTLAGK